MCDRLQRGQFLTVLKDDLGQCRSVDHAIDHHVGPAFGDALTSLFLQNGVTHSIGINGAYTGLLQQFADLALAGPKPTGKQPTMVQRTHNGRR